MKSNSSQIITDNDVLKDIEQLKERIQRFKKGTIDEERFKHFRLTRGVYGQRQLGVQMFRTKIPYGKLTADQLTKLADVSEQFTNGNLHLTTRQNVQLHYVKLEDSPAIWEELSAVGITARGACGNTVRNITASAVAGIDPEEPFDVSPYVEATFQYFLRNPICQEMGRKVKISFSSSSSDSAFGYFHDFGFIPIVKREGSKEIRGFKVLIGGGLGAVAMIAKQGIDFLPEERLLPFLEAAIRVFDRYGEREKRQKARLKFLVKKIGIEQYLKLVEEEGQSLLHQTIKIDLDQYQSSSAKEAINIPNIKVSNQLKFEAWQLTNTFRQKASSLYGVKVKVTLGDISAEVARQVARLVRQVAADDIRITVNQGLLLRHIPEAALPFVFETLNQLGLGDPGFDSIADVTACPGTDTCNLGVTNSTGLATELERVVKTEFGHLINNNHLKIKISGCMNSCGQHMAASIGFHGSSIKRGEQVIPAMQVVLGGGVQPESEGDLATKIIKVPTKRIPEALRLLLNDYDEFTHDGELYYNQYFKLRGRKYFYDLLKSLADVNGLKADELLDWNTETQYHQEIGIGECAGVSFDLVSTIIQDAIEKIELSGEARFKGLFVESIYHSYSAFVIGAKALLLAKDVKCNTHRGILEDFENHFQKSDKFTFPDGFTKTVLQFQEAKPDFIFAKSFFGLAKHFVEQVQHERNQQLGIKKENKVIGQYYNA